MRTLYFSEKPHDPNNPNSPTDFFITVDGQEPKVFDPRNTVPNIIAQQGDVEDWIIENRTQELHAFHIHQIHFMLVEWNGVPLDEPFLRDTINVAYWDGKSRRYPSVKLRMDFRDPNVVGTFVYHCHLLEHEDGGMMGVIRIVPNGRVGDLREIGALLGRPLCGLSRSAHEPRPEGRRKASPRERAVSYMNRRTRGAVVGEDGDGVSNASIRHSQGTKNVKVVNANLAARSVTFNESVIR